MEHAIKIEISENLYLYGTLNSLQTKSDKLIIFVHGFTGHSNEHFFYNAAQFFPRKGFDTARLNFYGFKKDTRRFIDSTILEHVQDLNISLRYFENLYRNIYLIGHSLGGPVVLSSAIDSPRVERIVLWEPSREPTDLVKDLIYHESIGAYIGSSHVQTLIGKTFVESAKDLPSIRSLVQRCTKPLKIISAEHAGGRIGKDLYFAHANEPKDFYLIKGSGHTFDEGRAETELFIETLDWLKYI